MRLLACPRCREVDTDNEDHPTGIKLCSRCYEELARELVDEQAGQVIDDPRARRRAERYEEHRIAQLTMPTDDELRQAAQAEAEHYEQLLRDWKH